MLMINCFWWFILEQTEGRKEEWTGHNRRIYFFGEDLHNVSEPPDGI